MTGPEKNSQLGSRKATVGSQQLWVRRTHFLSSHHLQFHSEKSHYVVAQTPSYILTTDHSTTEFSYVLLTGFLALEWHKDIMKHTLKATILKTTTLPSLTHRNGTPMAYCNTHTHASPKLEGVFFSSIKNYFTYVHINFIHWFRLRHGCFQTAAIFRWESITPWPFRRCHYRWWGALLQQTHCSKRSEYLQEWKWHWKCGMALASMQHLTSPRTNWKECSTNSRHFSISSTLQANQGESSVIRSSASAPRWSFNQLTIIAMRNSE